MNNAPSIESPAKRPIFGWAEVGLALIAIGYAVICYSTAFKLGRAEDFSFVIYSEAMGLTTFFLALAFFCGRIFYIMVALRPRHLTRFIIDDFKKFLFGHERVLRAVPVFLSFMIFMSAFTSMKMLIPLIQPFMWDETFAAWDRMLHGGTDPWRILHPFIGYPLATTAVNFVYNLWFFVMFGALYWQLFAVSNPQLRMQFFYSFFLSWIINGTLLAVLYSSAGPCFYQEFTGSDYYAPLMDYLRSAQQVSPVWALNTQDMLLQSYREYGIGLGTGISAMPSMHVSIAFIIALAARRAGRVPGIIMLTFAICILLGTVHLGWHYAIDGYIALLTTWLIWRLCGRLTRRLAAARLPGISSPAPADTAA